MITNQKVKQVASAVRTSEGFIEITSLELLDDIVGGLIDPDLALCQLNDTDSDKSDSTADTADIY